MEAQEKGGFHIAEVELRKQLEEDLTDQVITYIESNFAYEDIEILEATFLSSTRHPNFNVYLDHLYEWEEEEEIMYGRVQYLLRLKFTTENGGIVYTVRLALMVLFFYFLFKR